ncbi:MAG: pilus assembly protein [Acidobacteria bacterium]|nr:pilus assembly protein [Acidobacteriota bacterium]
MVLGARVLGAGAVRTGSGRRGQSTVEFALIYSAILLPLTFALVFTLQLLWIWHSVVDFTREGARYAATHCWQAGGANVIQYMRTHVPAMVDQQAFSSGPAEITVQYQARDVDTGELGDFECDNDCSVQCVPDLVRVSVSGYEFRHFMSYWGLPPVSIPNFSTSVAIESAGCDTEQNQCLP